MQSCLLLVCPTYLRLQESKINNAYRNQFNHETCTLHAYVGFEEVVQVYGNCIRMLHLPVISVTIIGVLQLSQRKSRVRGQIFRHHLFRAVFVRATYPSRYVYFRWSRVHTAVETVVTVSSSFENSVKVGSSLKPLKLVRFKCL